MAFASGQLRKKVFYESWSSREVGSCYRWRFIFIGPHRQQHHHFTRGNCFLNNVRKRSYWCIEVEEVVKETIAFICQYWFYPLRTMLLCLESAPCQLLCLQNTLSMVLCVIDFMTYGKGYITLLYLDGTLKNLQVSRQHNERSILVIGLPKGSGETSKPLSLSFHRKTGTGIFNM